MYTPKKLKWGSLVEFRDFLQRETTEKIVFFDGWRLVTETTEYGIIDGLLKINAVDLKKTTFSHEIAVLGPKPKMPKKKKLPKVKEKSKRELLAEIRERGKTALDKKKKNKS